MGPEDTSRQTLVFDTYQYSQTKLRQFKDQLPVQHVESLAAEVIRRMAAKDAEIKRAAPDLQPEELENFCLALISDKDDAAAKLVSGLRADGVPAEVVYLKHLAAAARMLGEWWTEDRASFVEVTLGSTRLLAIMRGMRHLFASKKVSLEKTAVFALVPEETHLIGINMATDLFREDGWDIQLITGLEHDALVSAIEAANCNIIGLSVSGEHSLAALSRLVVALHISCPQIPILVSGANIEDQRAMIDLIGVDGIASDIEDAKVQMAAMLAQNSLSA